MTEIKVFDRNGKVTYRYVSSKLLTEAQVQQDLRDMGVNTSNHRVVVINTPR